MAINKNDKGLTLIELLITIAVIAIVAAISVPVITNVIDSARDNSAGSMEAQVNSFIDKYTESGEVSFDGTDEFTAWVDLDGDGVFSSPAEVIETFTVDTTQFAVTITGTNAAPTGATVTAAGANNAGGNNNAGGPILGFNANASSVDMSWGGNTDTKVMYISGRTVVPAVGSSIVISGSSEAAYNATWTVVDTADFDGYEDGGTAVLITGNYVMNSNSTGGNWLG